MVREMGMIRWVLLALFAAIAAIGAEVCTVVHPTATLSIPHAEEPPRLDADPSSKMWRRSGSATILKDCRLNLEYKELKTEVRVFWSDGALYVLFICPYNILNLWLPSRNDQPRDRLWEHDVAEIFLGDDWKNIRHYREFEISPTADWIDLAIDLDQKERNRGWRSGWKTTARIEENTRIWYAAARIPLRSVSEAGVKPGTKWRMNLYRIDGEGGDIQRRFMCWQPTCVRDRDPNHVPENFGTLIFDK